MDYPAVPVPAEHLPAVYELLASLTNSAPDIDDGWYGDNEEEDDAYGSPSVDGRLQAYWQAVTDPAQTLLVAVAATPDKWMSYEDLEAASGLPNAGAALQSLSIQARKLGMPQPLTKKRNYEKKKLVYSMPAATAHQIIALARRTASA
jgi:hypothetical protein